MTTLAELSAGVNPEQLQQAQARYDQAKETSEQFMATKSAILTEYASLVATLKGTPEPDPSTMDGQMRRDFRSRFIDLLATGKFERLDNTVSEELRSAEHALRRVQKEHADALAEAAALIDNPYCSLEKTSEQNRQLLDAREALLMEFPVGSLIRPSVYLRLLDPLHPLITAYDRGDAPIIADAFFYKRDLSDGFQHTRGFTGKQYRMMWSILWPQIAPSTAGGIILLSNGMALNRKVFTLATQDAVQEDEARLTQYLKRRAKDAAAKLMKSNEFGTATFLDTSTPEGQATKAILEDQWGLSEKLDYLRQQFEAMASTSN